jgi:hypothetical protein
VSDLSQAVENATKLRFIHRVCRCGKRKVEVVEFGIMFVPLETVAQTSLLCSVVLPGPFEFIGRRLGGRNENVDGEQDLRFAFDLADTQTVSLVHKDELEALAQLK